MAIISISYYVVVLLEDSLSKLYPRIDTSVTYGSGFYLIAATGKKIIVNRINYMLIVAIIYRWCWPYQHILHTYINA